MSTYKFDKPNQSPWLTDVYNKVIPYKTDGFLVEIGVGHTIKGIDKVLPPDLTDFTRTGNNTADLIDLGWSGIYIDPVKEYCDEAKLAHINNLDRLKIVNIGASDKKEELELFLGDSFIPNGHNGDGYEWIGRTTGTDITSVILTAHNCPHDIDIMSIDVEGFEDRVLLGMDFELHSPKLIILEINVIGPDLISSILGDSYDLIAADGLNGVWKRLS